MKKILLSAVALAALTLPAAADPRKLTDTDMAKVTAGLYDVIFIMPVTVIHSSVNSAAVGIQAKGVASNAESNVSVTNIIGVNQSTDPGSASLPASAVFAGPGWPWADSGPSAGANGMNPLQAWTMIADMLRTRFLGRGW